MAEKEDQLGLMPSLSMGPSGYIPPMAATLASGLSGITAQQSALQKQIAQEQEQRRKELEAETERIAKTRFTLGQEIGSPEMMAQSAGLLAPGVTPFTPEQFAPQATAKRLESLKSVLESEVIPLETKQRAYNAVFPQGLAGAYMMAPAPTAPVAAAVPTGVAPAAAAPQVAPAPQNAPAAPAPDTLISPVSKTVRAAIEPLLGRIGTASNSLAATFRGLGLAAEALPPAQAALAKLAAKARAAKTVEDLSAIDTELAEIQSGITYQTPVGRAKPEEQFVSSGFVWQRKNEIKNGKTVSTIVRVAPVPITAAQAASLNLRERSLGISAENLKISRATLERLNNNQKLELENLLTTGIDDAKLQTDSYKDAVTLVEPQYAARLKSPYQSEKEKAQTEFDLAVKAKAKEIYKQRRSREERRFANTPAGKQRIRQILGTATTGGGTTAGAGTGTKTPREVNPLAGLEGIRVKPTR